MSDRLTDHPDCQPGVTLHLDAGDPVQDRVTICWRRTPRQVHTRSAWKDGVTTTGRLWLSDWMTHVRHGTVVGRERQAWDGLMALAGRVFDGEEVADG